MKQNLANSIILPPKNGGLKAWSHSVRKGNYVTETILRLKHHTEDKMQVLYNYFMVSVFGWPDPNARESCESSEKRAKTRAEGE